MTPFFPIFCTCLAPWMRTCSSDLDREVWGGLGMHKRRRGAQICWMGWMVVSPEGNRHPHITQWPHPEEVARHHREGLPGVPRKAGPDIQSSNASHTKSSTATWPKGILWTGTWVSPCNSALGIRDSHPLSPQFFNAACDSGTFL